MLTIIHHSTDATVIYSARELIQLLGQVYAGPISHTPAAGAGVDHHLVRRDRAA